LRVRDRTARFVQNCSLSRPPGNIG
jgi:hypothetical protein